jgi:hypothetical protein
VTLGKFKLNICPLRVISEESIEFVNLFNLCKSFQSLPTIGGIFNQDNRTMVAFETILQEINKIESEEEKKNKQQIEQQKTNMRR